MISRKPVRVLYASQTQIPSLIPSIAVVNNSLNSSKEPKDLSIAFESEDFSLGLR